MNGIAPAPNTAAASSKSIVAAAPKGDAADVPLTALLTLECHRPKRGKTVTLIAKAGDDVLYVESLDLTRSRSRERFADAVCEGRPGIDRSRIEAELLRIAGELASEIGDSGEGDGAGSGDKLGPADDLLELDAGRIVRPERFIAAEVAGLAVPTMVSVSGQPTGQNLLYLRWSDGRRQAVPLPRSLDVPDGDNGTPGRKLWMHPIPSDPTASQSGGWSQAARRQWCRGAVSPNPAALFTAICERFAHFLHLPATKAPGTTATLALWVMLTYIYPAFDAVPYLFVGGPMGSGKSRVFEILTRLAFRPLSSSNLSAAALFRTLHDRGGCLLLDEAERLKQTAAPDVSELLSLLLAGYKRGGQATRLEPVGDAFRTVAFDVFGPKALACIAGLPPALASRAIPVMMFRSPPESDKPRRRIDAEPNHWQQLRDDLHALALEHGPVWLDLPNHHDVCPTMSGRDYELWQPLLSIAQWIEAQGAEGLLELVQRHALDTIDDCRDDAAPDHDETLLRALADAVRKGDTPTATELLDAAKRQDAHSFDRWTARAVAGHLKRYGLMTNKTGGRKVYGRVRWADLREIQATYHLELGFDDDPPA